MQHPEQNTQIQVVRFIRTYYPDILFTVSPAAGERMDKNPLKNIIKTKRMKNMGYTKGTPDILFLERRGPFNGLAIELKRDSGGYATSEQLVFLSKLKLNGWAVKICHGTQKAIDEITAYFKLERKLNA